PLRCLTEDGHLSGMGIVAGRRQVPTLGCTVGWLLATAFRISRIRYGVWVLSMISIRNRLLAAAGCGSIRRVVHDQLEHRGTACRHPDPFPVCSKPFLLGCHAQFLSRGPQVLF